MCGVGERRFTTIEVQERLRRTSTPPAPRKLKKSFNEEAASFKPPPVPILIDGIKVPLRIDEFFGKTEGDAEKYINEDEKVVSFINGFGDSEMRERATTHLVSIIPQFESEGPFLEMIDVAKKIFDIKPSACVEFLHAVDHESKVEWKRDALIEIMPSFGSKGIIESFRLFAGIGERTATVASRQLVELGFRLKERSAIENIGKTIIALNDKFNSVFITHEFRSNLLDIARNSRISNENRALVVNTVCVKMLRAETEKEVDELNEKIKDHNIGKDPEYAIMKLGLPGKYIYVISYLKDRAGKEPEDAIKELFAKLAYEFEINELDAERFADVVLSLKPGLVNKASEAFAFSIAAGGTERGKEMAETVADRIMKLNPSALPVFLSEFVAFARTNFDADVVKAECNDPKWNKPKVTETLEN